MKSPQAMLFVGCSDFIVLKFEGANLYIEPGDGKDLVFETNASEVVSLGLFGTRLVVL